MARSSLETIAARRLRRRSLLHSGAILSASGVAAWALSACGGNKKQPVAQQGQAPAGATAQGQPQRGGRFSRTWSGTSTNLNPFANWLEGYHLTGIHVYDRLVTRHQDAQGRYVTQLDAAQSQEQPDPLTVTFKLKPNMVYQDFPPVNGRAVKADDLVAVQDYVRNLAGAENPGFQKNFLDHAEAPDDQTIVYHLKKPNAYLFAFTQLCNPTGQDIVPKEILDNMDTGKPIGSGPYYLADYTMNNRYLFKRFDKYRDAAKGLPYIDEHEVILLVDAVARESGFRGGQTQEYWGPPNGDVDRIAKDLGNKIVVEKFLSTGQFNTDLNMTKAPWTDARVREALYRLTNRQQFVDLVFDSKAVVPPGPMPANLKEYQLDPKETAPFFKNDVAEAKKLLTAAGWDFNKEYEISINNSPVNNQAGEIWQQQLAAGGVKVRPVPLPFAEWLPNRIGKGNFDLIIGAQPGGDTPYRPMRNNASDTLDVYSHVGLYDKDVDALIEKSEQTLDHDENVKLVKQIQMEILKRYTGHYIIVTQQQFVLRSVKLQNYEVDTLLGQVYHTPMWISA